MCNTIFYITMLLIYIMYWNGVLHLLALLPHSHSHHLLVYGIYTVNAMLLYSSFVVRYRFIIIRFRV